MSLEKIHCNLSHRQFAHDFMSYILLPAVLTLFPTAFQAFLTYGGRGGEVGHTPESTV